jgi:hypothetical protein
MPSSSVIALSDFTALKSKSRKSVVVQLTPAQWKNAIGGLTFSPGRPPEKFRGIRLVEAPGLGGGFAMPECPSPCQFRFEEGKFRCACTAPDDTDPPGGGGTPGAFQFCALIIGRNGSLRCAGLCAQTGRRCTLRAWQIPGSGVSFVSCACARP